MITIKHVAPLLAAAAITGALALAPAASAATQVDAAPTHAMSMGPAGTDPLLPYGPDPVSRDRLGYINPNHDEANTTNGEVDLPF